jgi:hypothetical protein
LGAAAAAGLAIGTVAAAQDTLSPDSFGAFAEGRTLHFTLDGLPFGAEQYFPGRRSRWRFEDGTCEEGVWWGAGELICFRYDGADGAQCWRFHGGPGGFSAALVEDGTETGFVLEFSHADDNPLDCPGPDVGS